MKIVSQAKSLGGTNAREIFYWWELLLHSTKEIRFMSLEMYTQESTAIPERKSLKSW